MAGPEDGSRATSVITSCSNLVAAVAAAAGVVETAVVGNPVTSDVPAPPKSVITLAIRCRKTQNLSEGSVAQRHSAT